MHVNKNFRIYLVGLQRHDFILEVSQYTCTCMYNGKRGQFNFIMCLNKLRFLEDLTKVINYNIAPLKFIANLTSCINFMN